MSIQANKVLSEKALNNDVDLYAKLEYFNPLGSVKDRLAIAMVDAAEESGDLKPGQTVVEATSGNTGYGTQFLVSSQYLFLSIIELHLQWFVQSVDTHLLQLSTI